MDNVYILYEERESSQLCGIKGVWKTKEKAIEQMKSFIKTNELYSDFSEINFEEGCSESDPIYSEEMYSNYSIQQMKVK